MKLAMLLGGLAVAVVSLMAIGAGTAAAEEPNVGEIDGPYFYGDDAGMPRWLRHSIIVCAAETMDVRVDVVKLGLRNGHSLKEIGIRAGVRPERLENGILHCEHHVIERLVHADKLDPEQGRRIFHFLEEHITRIINYQWTPAAN